VDEFLANYVEKRLNSISIEEATQWASVYLADSYPGDKLQAFTTVA
jgi:hypothetical protein